MRLQVTGRNLTIGGDVRAHAERRLGRLAPLLDDSVRVELELTGSPADGLIAEATAWTAGPVLRAEVRAADEFASIDLVVERLEEQIARYRAAGGVDRTPIVRVKRFRLRPMDPAEAVRELELVEHDFFVFERAGTGDVNVVYRRRVGGYGLLEPER